MELFCVSSPSFDFRPMVTSRASLTVQMACLAHPLRSFDTLFVPLAGHKGIAKIFVHLRSFHLKLPDFDPTCAGSDHYVPPAVGMEL